MVRGGGVFGLGNPEGRGGAQAVLEIQVEGRGVQKYAFHRGGGGGGGVWIFSGPIQHFSLSLTLQKKW